MKNRSSLALKIGILSVVIAGGCPVVAADAKINPDGEDAAPPPPPPTPAAAVAPAVPVAKPVVDGTKASANPAKAGEKDTDKTAPLPPSAELRTLPDCQTYLATPMDGAIIQVNKKFYFVSPKLPTDKTPGTTYLVEVDTSAAKAKRLAGFRGGPSATLLGHGRTFDTVSIMDFGGGKPDCGEGKTAATAIQWASQKVLPSYSIGNYGYVIGDRFGYLADLDKGAISDIDLVTQQKRTIDTFPAGTRPLYVKTSPPLVVFLYDTKKHELNRYQNLSKKPDETLRLKEGMKLVQQGDQFGIVQALEETKSLKISQIKDWSGTETKTFDLALPAGVQPSTLAVRINFQSTQTLVFGKDETARKELKQVFFYSGKDLAKTFVAPPESYFSGARFGKDGGILLLLSDMSSNVVREFWWMDQGSEVTKIDVIKEKKEKEKEKEKPKK
ncbi:MAG: hypothetical protein H7249_17455 [Chitinophagaceae bacterium]|nr:hypothetical protein [Oligoflexus sp.]